MANKDIHEEQFDRAMRALIADASITEPEVDDIANSPSLWWSVRREIDEQRTVKSGPWPPVTKVWRWLLIGAPVAAATVLLLVFTFSPASRTSDVAESVVPNIPVEVTPAPVTPAPNVAIPMADPIAATRGHSSNEQTASKAAKLRSAPDSEVAVQKSVKTETRSAFIALSYAQNAESGQLVRVKVPSAMMVSLGLVQAVAKPSDLVDAEVLVGDDGLTRAIRFIRQ